MQSNTINLQTEDQIAGIRVLWEELADPYPGLASGVPDRHTADLADVHQWPAPRQMLLPRIMSAFDQPIVGRMMDVRVAQPALGAPWSFTLPGGFAYRLALGYARLTSGALVGNREASLAIYDGDGNLRGRFRGGGNTSAKETIDLTYAAGMASSTVGNPSVQHIGVPSIWLPAGWRYASLSTESSAEDQYSNVRLWLAEAFDPDPSIAPGSDELDEHTWDQVGMLMGS